MNIFFTGYILGILSCPLIIIGVCWLVMSITQKDMTVERTERGRWRFTLKEREEDEV